MVESLQNSIEHASDLLSISLAVDVYAHWVASGRAGPLPTIIVTDDKFGRLRHLHPVDAQIIKTTRSRLSIAIGKRMVLRHSNIDNVRGSSVGVADCGAPGTHTS